MTFSSDTRRDHGCLFSVNDIRVSLADADQVVTRLLSPEYVRAHVLLILALQETRSWDVQNLSLPGFVSCGNKFGLTTLVVSDRYCKKSRDHGDLRRVVQPCS